MLKYALLPCLLVLTGPASAQDIVPRDGTWTVRSIEAVMGDLCPPFLAPMAEQMKDGLGRRVTYDVVWGGTFDPNTAAGLNPDNQPVTWVQDDTTRWHANLAGPDKDYVVARMELVSDGLIRNRVDMDVAAMMETEGGQLPGVEGCALTMTYVMEHKG